MVRHGERGRGAANGWPARGNSACATLMKMIFNSLEAAWKTSSPRVAGDGHIRVATQPRQPGTPTRRLRLGHPRRAGHRGALQPNTKAARRVGPTAQCSHLPAPIPTGHDPRGRESSFAIAPAAAETSCGRLALANAGSVPRRRHVGVLLPDGERGRARADREQRAKELCRRCPVIAQCRAHALAVGEPFGVWGGLSESDRERLLNPPDSHAHTQHDHEIGRTTYSRKSVV